jgi:hypothetical protein
MWKGRGIERWAQDLGSRTAKGIAKHKEDRWRMYTEDHVDNNRLNLTLNGTRTRHKLEVVDRKNDDNLMMSSSYQKYKNLQVTSEPRYAYT